MKKYIEQGMEYSEYIGLIDRLLDQRKTTGPNQSEEMFNYGKLNRQRMRRLGKTVDLSESLAKRARSIERKMVWLIITESWCGDAAQSIPIFEKIARESSNIKTIYVFRDENLELMDKYLTNDARSIPKLIALDSETLEELGTWGPRPRRAMEYFYEMRETGLEKSEMMENLQRWYLKDKERSIQEEFEEFLTELESVKVAVTA
ncbi:MAG: thioredoxin family protein [Pyrinomonadaceae bacterium]|nr:thioredoxin family protein [Pyrinomonadaceae bacterium]